MVVRVHKYTHIKDSYQFVRLSQLLKFRSIHKKCCEQEDAYFYILCAVTHSMKYFSIIYVF